MPPPGAGDRVSEKEAREWAERFVVADGTADVLHIDFQLASDGHLPVADGGEDQGPRPLCGHLTNADSTYRRKSLAAYPPGFKPICKNCRERLHQRQSRR